MNIKLRAIGNSQGFSLPKEALNQAGFHLDDEYEIQVSEGVISIVKRLDHHSTWKFTDAPLSDEHRAWIENELER